MDVETDAIEFIGDIPYEKFKAGGLPALLQWYEEIGVRDVRDIHIYPESMDKLCDILDGFHHDRCQVNMAMAMYGPSGFHKDVPLDKYRLLRPTEDVRFESIVEGK